MKKNLYILFLFFSIFLSAQADENDKLLSEAKDLVYKNPEQTVIKAKEVLRNSHNEAIKISALITLINAQMVMGQAKNVIDNCNAALEIARKENDSVNEILLLAMLGNQYQTMMMTEEAKKYLDLAENKLNSTKLPKNLLYIKGNVYNIKGILFRSELNCEFALKYFDKAINLYKTLPKTEMNDANQLLVEIQKGFCLISQGKLDMAEQCFLKVTNNDMKIDLGFNKFFAQVGLAEILTSRGHYTESLKLLDLITLDDSENFDFELSSMYNRAKSRNYLHIEDMENYVFYYKKYETEITKMDVVQDKVIDQTIRDSKEQMQKKSKEIRLVNFSILVVLILFFVFVLVFLIKNNFFFKK